MKTRISTLYIVFFKYIRKRIIWIWFDFHIRLDFLNILNVFFSLFFSFLWKIFKNTFFVYFKAVWVTDLYRSTTFKTNWFIQLLNKILTIKNPNPTASPPPLNQNSHVINHQLNQLITKPKPIFYFHNPFPNTKLLLCNVMVSRFYTQG